MAQVLAHTLGGDVAGRERHGIWRFAGIPYAAPPTGARRFREPERVEPWSGVRDARSFGPVAWQSSTSLSSAIGGGPHDHSEDCLTLNVFTRACDEGARPVMVWIHGGGFASGSGSIPWYDGTSFVRRGDVVVVTVNYRLGALGFLDLSSLGGSTWSTSGINGLLDQVAALEWVRENIAAFGGDPDNVTIFGESAGAMSIATLLAMPCAAGLFHRAILESGGANNTLSPGQARRVTEAMLAELAIDDVDDIVMTPPESLIAAQDVVLARATADPTWLRQGGFSLAMPFQPVRDGTVLTGPPLELIEQGSAAGVSLLAGTNLDEWNLFDLVRAGELDTPRLTRRLDRHFMGRAVEIIEGYRSALTDASPDEIWRAVLTDTMFRIPTIEVLEAQYRHRPSETYAYLFSWASTAFEGRLGSCHALELPFVWNITDRPGTELLLGSGTAPTELALAMHDSWWHFASSGDPAHAGIPEWSCYETAHRATLEFASLSRLVHDPQASRRKLWSTT